MPSNENACHRRGLLEDTSPSGFARPTSGIRPENLTKIYANDVTAIDDISLEIASGEWWGERLRLELAAWWEAAAVRAYVAALRNRLPASENEAY